MPKVTEAHMEARRRQILDAASACFARQGFHQTTMQEICREADLSPGGVYRYFASKYEIIAATCQECHLQNLSLIQAASEQSDDPLEVLDLLVDSGFGWLDNPEALEHLRMNIQLWAEAVRSPQVMEAYQRANFDVYREALCGLLRRAQENGAINPCLDPDSAARVLLATWQGLVLQKALDSQVDVPKYVAVLKSLYKGTFAPQPAASAATGTTQNQPAS